MELSKRTQCAKAQLSQKAVLDIIRSEDTSAHALLWERAPDAARRFDRAAKAMQKTLEEVRKYFPDACYYSASDTLCLMLGDPHDEHNHQQQILVAIATNRPMIGGGDW